MSAVRQQASEFTRHDEALQEILERSADLKRATEEGLATCESTREDVAGAQERASQALGELHAASENVEAACNNLKTLEEKLDDVVTELRGTCARLAEFDPGEISTCLGDLASTTQTLGERPAQVQDRMANWADRTAELRDRMIDFEDSVTTSQSELAEGQNEFTAQVSRQYKVVLAAVILVAVPAGITAAGVFV